MPYVAAIASGNVTSFDTKTELFGMPLQAESEKVAFLTIESIARSNTVALKS